MARIDRLHQNSLVAAISAVTPSDVASLTSTSTSTGRYWKYYRKLPDIRYVVNLVNIRKYHEFVFQRRQGDVLILHSADTAFKRLVSVRYARNGKPSVITDTAFAESDFQQQIAFWFARIPGR